jgi:hypothetical protein
LLSAETWGKLRVDRERSDMQAIHLDDEDNFGSALVTELFFFFVRKEIDKFTIKTSDETLKVEGFIQDNRRVVRLVDTA